MILFLNVFITDDFVTEYWRGNCKNFDRLSVFKYSLSSLSVIPWSKVFIYCKLDVKYQEKWEELENYINKVFAGKNVSLNNFRIDRQNVWKQELEKVFEVSDELVWFSCNDDHIFMDYDLEMLNICERRVKECLKNHEYVGCYVSHWPEMLYHCNYNLPHDVLGKSEHFFEVEWKNIDSIQILNKNVLKSWFFSVDYGEDAILVRSDGNIKKGPNYRAVKPVPIRTIIPLREMCRHFDGYSRPYLDTGSSDVSKCPPLTIPDGFFENDIKISFCKEKREEGYVYVNPFVKDYYVVNLDGVDYKWMIEDIPLFWRDKISDIKMGPTPDREVLCFARNKSIRDLARAEKMFKIHAEPVPIDWICGFRG